VDNFDKFLRVAALKNVLIAKIFIWHCSARTVCGRDFCAVVPVTVVMYVTDDSVPYKLLQEQTIVPSDSMLFPEYDWLIGNHSDELTPWIPFMAAR